MIAVIILHYRNLDDTLECLASLRRQDHPRYEIILVDNSNELEPIDGVHLIKNEENLGFAEGNNIGIRHAMQRGADAVLLLNNDTTVAPDLLSRFVQAMHSHPDAGAFGAKIFFYEEPTLLWHAGGNVNLKTMRCYHEGCGESDLAGKYDKVRDINYACGCALFVTRNAIEKAGLMAPEFFLIWEEIDWCWRIRKAGFQCLFVPEAKVWHKISQAFEGGNRGPLWQYYYFRNRLLFMRRHFSLRERFKFYSTVFLQELGQILFSREERSRFALKGVRDYFLNRFSKIS